eukprot:maker-scaffold_48-snap-gene-1.39-mRNA-1 protein AED:0.23 eAED:0.23 QI:99/1/1/1/1/1/6/167/200
MSDSKKLKLVVVGDGAVGKTCLILSFADPIKYREYLETYEPTVLDTFVITVGFKKNQSLELELWDTAGQEGFKEVRKLSYPGTDGFMVCFGSDQEKSLNNVQNVWLPEILKDGKMRDIKGVEKASSFVVVGTKADLLKDKDEREYVKKRAKDVTTHMGGSDFVLCSSITGEGLQDAFKYLIRAAYRNKYVVSSGRRCSLL